MNIELQKVLHLKNYFRAVQIVGNSAKCIFERPSRILMHNIHSSWLKSLLAKTYKQFPIYLDVNKRNNETKNVPYGFVESKGLSPQKLFTHDFSSGDMLLPKSELEINLIVPSQDLMQYFIQWQRYRKYWWSSITTTPSLFAIGDIIYKDRTADVNIIAKFPFGQQIVETITTNSKEVDIVHASCLSSTISLEGAVFILLTDALHNENKEGYLRLHRTMTPYKFAFAIESKDARIMENLTDLAKLLFYKLETKKISTFLPNFSVILEDQIKENLQIGVTYTAVLRDSVIQNGIFHLLNSSTMLKEQLHIADFDNYAALINNK